MLMQQAYITAVTIQIKKYGSMQKRDFILYFLFSLCCQSNVLYNFCPGGSGVVRKVC
jgi:hypothetical protein